jgi:hypothetical protein
MRRSTSTTIGGKMIYSETIMRIKAIAWVLGKETSKMDDDALMSIVRQANAGEWDLVWDTFRKVA